MLSPLRSLIIDTPGSSDRIRGVFTFVNSNKSFRMKYSGRKTLSFQDVELSDLNERQEWIMERISNGTEFRVGMVVEQFHCSSRTAKRDLAELKKMGLVRFVGSPRQGHYREKNEKLMTGFKNELRTPL